MRPNPFQAPGSEHFNRMKGAFPTTPTDLFKPPQGGSRKGAPRQLCEENAEEAEILDIPLEESASSEESPKAVLSDPGWVKPVSLFHEEAEVSVKLLLPESKKHLTRVVAELHARTPDGPQYVVKAEGHADENGVAFVKLPIYQPQGYQGGPIEYFTVFKHVMAKALSTESHPRDVSEMAIRSADHTLIPGISFSKETSFIGPKAAAGLKDLERKAGEWEKNYPKGQIVVFGHAEQDETDPKALSERRARSALAFITNDAATWESLYQSEAWGLIPLQVLLKDLGHYKDKVDGEDGPNTQAAFKAIQRQSSLPETGKADAATRMALFAAYMQGKHDIRLSASRFRTVAGNPWMGCAANNRVKDGENSEPENRRVVFLLLNESKHFPIYFYCQDGSETPCRQQCRREGKRSSPGIKCWFYDMLVREEKPNPGSEEAAGRTLRLAQAQEIAFEISSDFEGEGYSALTGDGDGQGISFGCMQWNIGQNTLQPLWKKFWKKDPKAFRDCFDSHDDAFKQVEKILKGTTNAKALQWARSTHDLVKNKTVWKDPWKRTLLNLAEVPAFQAIQRSEAGALNHPPTVVIVAWLRKALPNLFRSIELRSYVALFDLFNQQGSVKQKNYKVVGELYKTSPPTSQREAMEILCANRALTATRAWRADAGSRRLGILAGCPTLFPNSSYPSPGLKPATRPNKKFNLIQVNPFIEDL